MDDIDAASQRALPQLHVNNAANSSSDSRVQGLYRRAWYSNTLLLEQVKPLLDRLETTGVGALTTKQSAVVVTARGCYPLDRFHLSVGAEDLEKALGAFHDTGWLNQGRHPSGFAEFALRGITFERNRFLAELSCEPLRNGGVRSRAETVKSDATCYEVPGHVDQLLEAAAPRHVWHRTSVYQRLLGTLLVIRYGNGTPDWSLLALTAAEGNLTLPLADALEYLERDLGIELPDGYLAKLRGELVTPRQAREHRLKQEARSLPQRIRLGSLEYRQLKELAAAHNEALSILDYLKLRWDVKELRGILKHLVSTVSRPTPRQSL
jgi:hypothetical protein